MSYAQLKERIKEAPVSLVVGNYLTLNKKGTNLEALCPFHADSKPSLKVSDNKGMYKCFVCGEGGDSITFVMKYKNLEFAEALKEICGIIGIPFEEQKEKRKNPKVEMAFRVLDASVKLYKKVAGLNLPVYVEFLKNRKLLPETVEKWEIGYAPGNNALYKYLDDLPGADGDAARTVAKELQIIRYNETRDSHYDLFRDRVMFPIHNHQGQICGYSARAVLPEQEPKYLNSVESLAFHKGSILFGYHFAKNAIRHSDQVIIVEGNIDVIMMHQYGFNQTVGTMGTALSETLVRQLSNMTKNVFLALDSDKAGKKAMQRITGEFLILGVLPKFLSFDPHKDPDEFLVHEGRLALIERMEKAPIYLDVLIQEQFPDVIPENTDIKLGILHKIFDLVSPLKEGLSATERIVNAAKILGLRSDSASIIENYRERLSRQKEKVPHKEERLKLEEIEENLEKEVQKAQKLQRESISQVQLPLTASEKLVLKEFLCHPEFLTHLKVDDFLATVGHHEVKRLIQWLVKIYLEIDDSEYVSIVQEELQYGGYSKEIIDIGTAALFNSGALYNEKVIQRLLVDYQRMMKLDQLKIRRKEFVDKQKSSQTQIEVDSILAEISKIDKEILGLKNTAL